MAAAAVNPSSSQPGGLLLAVGAMGIIQLGIALSEPLFAEVGPTGVVARDWPSPRRRGRDAARRPRP